MACIYKYIHTYIHTYIYQNSAQYLSRTTVKYRIEEKCNFMRTNISATTSMLQFLSAKNGNETQCKRVVKSLTKKS